MKGVGLVGVGLMGHGIATNVLRAGYPLGFLSHPGNQPTDALVAGGAVAHDTIASLVNAKDVVILCVTGAPQVEAVMAEVIPALRDGMTVIDCSTSLPETTRKLAAEVEAAGARFLDAPMTRTPKEAAEGRLNLIVGGDEALYRETLPLLQSFAEEIAHVGPVGSGHAMKLLHNYVSLGYAAVLAEAAACAARTGVDPHAFSEVLAKGGGGGVVLDRLRPFIESGDTSGLRFSIANARKDTGYYTGMAREAGAPLAVAEAVAALYDSAAKAGCGECAVPELIEFLKETT